MLRERIRTAASPVRPMAAVLRHAVRGGAPDPDVEAVRAVQAAALGGTHAPRKVPARHHAHEAPAPLARAAADRLRAAARALPMARAVGPDLPS